MSWDDFWRPRRLFGLLTLLVLLGLAASTLAGLLVFDVRISEEQLNRTAAAKLPFERKSGPVVWRIEAAKLTVLDRGRIAVDARLRAATAGREGEARVAGSGIVAYREGAFWLSDIDVDALDIGSVRALETRPPSALGKALGGLVGRSERLKRALESAEDKALALGAREAGPVLDAWFKAGPVYRLRDDWKGNVARWTLVSLRTEAGALVARLDPAGEAMRVAAGALLVLVLAYSILCLVAAFTSWLGGFADALLFWW